MATAQETLEALTDLRLNIIQAGGVKRWRESGHEVEYNSLAELNQAIADLQEEVQAQDVGFLRVV